MTPKQIQQTIVDALRRQLAVHGIILPAEAISDAAAQAAMILHADLVEPQEDDLGPDPDAFTAAQNGVSQWGGW